MKRLLFVLLYSAATAFAADAETLRANGSGELIINTEGKVVSLDFATSFGDQIDAVLEQRIGAWRFEPIVENGKPVQARAHFQLSLQADFAQDRMGELRITDIDFVNPPMKDVPPFAEGVVPPRYPPQMLRDRLGAEVILQIKIDESGKVLETSGQSGWLFARYPSNSEKKNQRAMTAFIGAADKAVREWRFTELARQGKRYGQLPITFFLNTGSPWRRAQWVRMPKEDWTAQIDAASFGAVNSSGVPLRTDLRLLDALDAEVGTGG